MNDGCRFSLYEPIEFIKTHLKDKLEWEQVRDNVAIHVPCSSKKMGITDAFTEVASLCAKEVTPSNIPCCGEPPPPADLFFQDPVLRLLRLSCLLTIDYLTALLFLHFYIYS